MSHRIFITGSNGYIGSYICDYLRLNSSEKLSVLIRAKSHKHALERLWQAWQLHMTEEEFVSFCADRVKIYLGDLTKSSKFGLDDGQYRSLVDETDSIIHVAASLNRRSDRVCFNVNLRGTLHVIKLAQVVDRTHGLKKISEVSTVAVAGERKNEVVLENDMIDWARKDYDPYARTKKFGEYMVEEYLADLPSVVFRPSIVLGDSRKPQTTQFDMVKVFVWLSKAFALPFYSDWKLDIVPANFVGHSIAKIHLKDQPSFHSYNLSSGRASLTYKEITTALTKNTGRSPAKFIPLVNKPLGSLINVMASMPRSWGLSQAASLLGVFWPYLNFNTVFDNTRVIQELGEAPVSFSEYAAELRDFAIENKCQYPHVSLSDKSFKTLEKEVV